jgi:hypothetical protein
MLASMHLLSNPQFFNHMMMPPYNPMNWDPTSDDVQMDIQGVQPTQQQQQNSELQGLAHGSSQDQRYASGPAQQPTLIPYPQNSYPNPGDFTHGTR